MTLLSGFTFIRSDDTHPAVMEERMRKHTARLSLSSEQWRQNLHWNERWRMMKSFLVNHITGRFSNKGSYKLWFFRD